MEPNIELLAPAGSAESLRAAVNAGADAVYMGSTRFGARALADNPDEHSFMEAMDYAHLHGCKVYLTVNTLLKEEETGELYAYLKPFYERGIDAVIVQDYGALLLIRKWFPDLRIHASTQMTVTGRRFAEELKRQGVSRVILARELSLSEISSIADSVDIELECFVHGALCYCYSGQCLMSSLIGGRSGNRGRCAQPCRLPYSAGSESGSCLLNMKDLEALKILPDIIDAGVCALKIEGRMKSPRYTAGVVSVYRRYLDLLKNEGKDGYSVTESDILALNELFDRGGYTEGYFFEHNGKDMLATEEKPDFRKTDQKYFSFLDREYVNTILKIPVNGDVMIHEGEQASLTISDPGDDNFKVTVKGPLVSAAKTQPADKDQVIRQIERTGDSIYTFADLNCDLRGSCFMALSQLNELRRQALKAFEDLCLNRYRRNSSCDMEDGHRSMAEDGENALKSDPGRDFRALPPRAPDIHVSIQDTESLGVILSFGCVKEVYLDCDGIDASEWKTASENIHAAGKRCALILPSVFRTDAQDYLDRNIAALKESCFDEMIIRSLEEPGYLKENDIDLPLVFDANIYAWNKASVEAFRNMGAARITLPVELNSHELTDLGGSDKELIAYGHIPVMVTAQCVKRTVSGCDKKPACLYMKDRTGRSFPVKNTCRFCYNTIYNAVPLTLIGEEQKVERISPAVLRLMFTTESPFETGNIIMAYEEAFISGDKVEIPFKEYTRGHFNRGVG